MASVYNASHVSLHVRRSNLAAIALYRDTLGFEIAKIEAKYCNAVSCFVDIIFTLCQMVMVRMHYRCGCLSTDDNLRRFCISGVLTRFKSMRESCAPVPQKIGTRTNDSHSRSFDQMNEMLICCLECDSEVRSTLRFGVVFVLPPLHSSLVPY